MESNKIDMWTQVHVDTLRYLSTGQQVGLGAEA